MLEDDVIKAAAEEEPLIQKTMKERPCVWKCL